MMTTILHDIWIQVNVIVIIDFVIREMDLVVTVELELRFVMVTIVAVRKLYSCRD